LAHIQPENLQNVQKKRFWQKAPGVNGLSQNSNGDLVSQGNCHQELSERALTDGTVLNEMDGCSH